MAAGTSITAAAMAANYQKDILICESIKMMENVVHRFPILSLQIQFHNMPKW